MIKNKVKYVCIHRHIVHTLYYIIIINKQNIIMLKLNSISTKKEERKYCMTCITYHVYRLVCTYLS